MAAAGFKQSSLTRRYNRGAQIDARDRAARAFELVFLARRTAGRKHKSGAVQFVFDALGHDAHHAFVKVRVKHTYGGRGLVAFVKQRLGHLHRHLAHIAFDHAAFAVDRVQLPRQLVGAACVVGQ